jgi:DNA polymerase
MNIDFECYSEAGYYWDAPANRWLPVLSTSPGIAAVGAWMYSVHPSCDLISLVYDDKLWVAGQAMPTDLYNRVISGELLWAWNSFFEFCIWNNVAVPKYGWPPVPLSQFRCAMARARAWGLPGKLENAGKALELGILKDTAGSALIRKLCIPRSPTITNPLQRLTIESNPVDFFNFFCYNRTDVAAEKAITEVTPPLLTHEEKLWLLDQTINARGVHVDRYGLENCITIFNRAADQYTQELQDLTAGAVSTANELQKIGEWLQTQGVQSTSLDKEHIDQLVAGDLPAPCRRVLEIRQILGSASVKKLFSIQRYLADDNRIRGLFSYCGAERTGRFAGMGPQPQNMPSSGPPVKKCRCGAVQWAELPLCRKCGAIMPPDVSDWCVDAVELALADISSGDLSTVERNWGDPLNIISGCLRGLFTAAPGNELISSDYSAIEAVVLAALAGEEWRLDVFRTHGKIYEMSAAKISGVPFQDFLDYKKSHGQHHPLRKKIGKVAELASGYAGWIGAWKNFGADKFMTDPEIKQNIIKWRGESPAIVEFWGGQCRKHPNRWEFKPELFGLEGAVVMALLNPGQCFSYRSISYGVKDKVLYCRLPSGRMLAYHKPGLRRYFDSLRELEQWKITFWGWDSPTHKWVEIETYGGKMAENVTQAVARDVLTHALPRIESAGYPVVLHVHDEPTSEVPAGFGSVDEYEKLMREPPPWAADWPIKAGGGWRGLRYRK